MRRIDSVKNRKMKNIEYAQVVDKKRLKIVFDNGAEIILKSICEDFGYDSGIYIEKDTIYDKGRD